MSSGLNYGFRHGYWNALGLQLALLVQIAVVAAGVGVLFATTPWAFLAVKWFGVAYLLICPLHTLFHIGRTFVLQTYSSYSRL